MDPLLWRCNLIGGQNFILTNYNINFIKIIHLKIYDKEKYYYSDQLLVMMVCFLDDYETKLELMYIRYNEIYLLLEDYTWKDEYE